MCIYMYIVLRKSRIPQENHLALVYFSYRVHAGFTVFIEEYPEYLFYLGLSIILFLDLEQGGKNLKYLG